MGPKRYDRVTLTMASGAKIRGWVYTRHADLRTLLGEPDRAFAVYRTPDFTLEADHVVRSAFVESARMHEVHLPDPA